MAEYPEAQFIVRVKPTEIFPNCPRYIHKMETVDRSPFVPRAGCETPVPDWKKSDDERPLTKRGKKEMHEIAAFLVRLKARPNLILTSPLPRAAQTAEIAAEHLEVKCREDRRLAPGFGPAELEELIRKNSAESLMIVGHEPDFTKTISALTGASLKLSKAGIALVDVDLSSRKGRLLWLFPPKVAKN